MMKPGPNYRMSKAGKINLAVNWSRPAQAQRRRSIMQAELYGAQILKSKRERDN